MKPLYKDRIIARSILLTAAFFLFWDITLKPPHFDEGVNGFFVNQIWENGYFKYDPTNYHGPLLFYLFQISEKIFGFGVHAFRLVTAGFMLLTVWFVLDALPESASQQGVAARAGAKAAAKKAGKRKEEETVRTGHILWGLRAHFFIAAALALSPGMIFFGRSAIHEPVFVFFQVAWVTGFLRLREQRDRAGILWLVAGFFGCALLKETFVILALSFLLAWTWAEYSPSILGAVKKDLELPAPSRLSDVDAGFLLKVCLAATSVWLVLYSGFFHNMKGVSDFFTALMPWLKTGTGGSGHDKPFYYWLKLFSRYEWAAMAGVIGAFAGIAARSWRLRFFSALALINLLIYSLIPYKTPWCVISVIWPFVFVSGIWLESIAAGFKPGHSRVFMLSMSAAAVVIFGYSAVAAYRLNFINYAEPSEPYVYVQTKKDFKSLDDIMRKKIMLSPASLNMGVMVKLKHPWPLPWTFSHYPHIEYRDHKEAHTPGPEVILGETTVNDEALAGLYLRRQIELRDAWEPIFVYLKKSAFKGMSLPGFNPVPAPQSAVIK